MRIQNRDMLTEHGNKRGRAIVAELLDAALDSIDPYYRVKELVHLEDGKIVLDNRDFEMKGDPHSGPAVYDLHDFERIFVIGAGKGIQHAALALEEVLGDHLTAGHVIAKYGEDSICKKIGVTFAGHPVPDACCVEGCKRIAALADGITARDLVFTIFGSGCGSLLTYPAGAITIEELSQFTRMMQIEKGVPTSDLNPIRTHIDRLKGGRITRLFKQATLVHLTTADPSKMGTPVTRMSYFEMLRENTFFPTVATGTTYADCLAILHKWDAWDETPQSIRDHLISGTTANENMSVEEYESLGCRFFGLIFKDRTLYPAVRKRAEQLGYPCRILTEYLGAEAREAGFVDASIALTIERMNEPLKSPIVLISSGETVVTVGKEHGIGGRNQEYCMAAAIAIDGSKRIVFGAVDTDGTDGPGGFVFEGAPECLAGAIVDSETLTEARNHHIDFWAALKSHGTSEPLWRLGCGVAATSNVSALDLRVILVM